MKMGTWATALAGFESRDMTLKGLVSICSGALRSHHGHTLLGGLERACGQLLVF